jgi:hypothetical protein
VSEPGIVPDFGDPDDCYWCEEEARGVAETEHGWLPSCGDPLCGDGLGYRGAR